MTAVGRRAARALLAAGLVALGAWTLLDLAGYRGLEAQAAARLVQSTVGGGTSVNADRATFYVGLGTDHPLGLRIEQICSTGAVAGGVLFLTGTLVAVTAVRLGRVLLGCSAMVALVFAVNTLRLTALSWSIVRWGRTGRFEWLHLYGGAFVTTCAVAVGSLLYLSLLRHPDRSGVG